MTDHKIRLIFRVLVAVALAGSIVRAEEAAATQREYDRFDLRFGGGWVFGADTTATLIGHRGIGTVIDFNKTLDGQSSNSLIRFDGTWRINLRNSLTYSWYDVNRTGVRTIAQEIDFGDQTYPVGARVDSQLDIKLNRFLYRYGLARTDDIDFDIGGGIYLGNINMTLTSESNVGPVTTGTAGSTSLKAPLPTFGVNLDCRITQKLSTTFSADWFYFAYNDWEGAQTDIMIGLAYKLARHFTLGVAYDRFTLNLKGPASANTSFKVENAWNSLFSYLSFHW